LVVPKSIPIALGMAALREKPRVQAQSATPRKGQCKRPSGEAVTGRCWRKSHPIVIS
jgi:hypothetical protein